MHGIYSRKHHIPAKHLGLRGWYMRKRKQRIDAEIRNILNLWRPADAAYADEDAIMLPSVWSHRTEGCGGSTAHLM
ncbi:MAG TPA: hypothetical protein VIM53_00465 [Candidatus Saccharimonadales bacterium]